MTNASTSGPNIRNLILAPAIISFAITILRLVGELNQWSPAVFSREAGGGGSLLGISWLVPVFGVYFAVKLVRDGYTPKSNMKVILFAILGAVPSATPRSRPDNCSSYSFSTTFVICGSQPTLT